jgi:ABC-type uncharacterized transport system permease subunit
MLPAFGLADRCTRRAAGRSAESASSAPLAAERQGIKPTRFRLGKIWATGALASQHTCRGAAEQGSLSKNSADNWLTIGSGRGWIAVGKSGRKP